MTRGGRAVPIRHQIRRDLGLAVSIHIGIVTDQEFLDSYEALFNDPDYDLNFSRLVDLRKTDSSSRSSEALRAIAALVRRRYEGVETAPKTAVVAPRDLSFGLARMYQALSELVPGDVVVFRSVDAALAWLGVPDETIPAVRASEKLGDP
jgi:hypothetical protein